jgi:hypothetical protein
LTSPTFVGDLAAPTSHRSRLSPRCSVANFISQTQQNSFRDSLFPGSLGDGPVPDLRIFSTG